MNDLSHCFAEAQKRLAVRLYAHSANQHLIWEDRPIHKPEDAVRLVLANAATARGFCVLRQAVFEEDGLQLCWPHERLSPLVYVGTPVSASFLRKTFSPSVLKYLQMHDALTTTDASDVPLAARDSEPLFAVWHGDFGFSRAWRDMLVLNDHVTECSSFDNSGRCVDRQRGIAACVAMLGLR
jgi:hypothetical protein